jgi:hypothetical protein
MNFELLKQVLLISIGSSIISTTLIQKIKEGYKFKNSKKIILISFGVSMVIGTLFSLSFTDLNMINSLWVGLISFIGADAVYKTFEDKIFKSFGEITKKESE